MRRPFQTKSINPPLPGSELGGFDLRLVRGGGSRDLGPLGLDDLEVRTEGLDIPEVVADGVNRLRSPDDVEVEPIGEHSCGWLTC